MTSKAKRFLAAAAAAANLAVVVPATAADTSAAIGPCGLTRIADGVKEWYQEVLVTGEHAARGAIDVELTCGIVRYGETVWMQTDTLSGPVAAMAEMASVHAGPIGSCYILHVVYVEHYTFTDTCP